MLRCGANWTKPRPCDAAVNLRSSSFGLCGAAGYIDFAGNMDTCMALRTLVITPLGDNDPQSGPAGKQGRPTGWRVDAQVGAGIVADSQPASEFEETCNKAQSMLSALELANAWQRG